MPKKKRRNPAPKTEHLKKTMFHPLGHEPMGSPIGTRYPRAVDSQLREMPSAERQRLIRAAVAKALGFSSDIPVPGE